MTPDRTTVERAVGQLPGARIIGVKGHEPDGDPRYTALASGKLCQISGSVVWLSREATKGLPMTHGTIKTIRDDKGFGFITPDGETQDVFFHSSALEYGAFDQLREGQRVQFTSGADPKNPMRMRAETVELTNE